MGYAARANRLSLTNAQKRERIIKRNTVTMPKAKVFIPRTTMKPVDVFEAIMGAGLRPMTAEEKAEAKLQGFDMTPPDIKEKNEVKQLTKDPEVRLIHLTDE